MAILKRLKPKSVIDVDAIKIDKCLSQSVIAHSSMSAAIATHGRIIRRFRPITISALSSNFVRDDMTIPPLGVLSNEKAPLAMKRAHKFSYD